MEHRGTLLGLMAVQYYDPHQVADSPSTARTPPSRSRGYRMRSERGPHRVEGGDPIEPIIIADEELAACCRLIQVLRAEILKLIPLPRRWSSLQPKLSGRSGSKGATRRAHGRSFPGPTRAEIESVERRLHHARLRLAGNENSSQRTRPITFATWQAVSIISFSFISSCAQKLHLDRRHVSIWKCSLLPRAIRSRSLNSSVSYIDFRLSTEVFEIVNFPETKDIRMFIQSAHQTRDGVCP